MEKRLRRARTVAIVLAVIIHIATKMLCVEFYGSSDRGISEFLLPALLYIIMDIALGDAELFAIATLLGGLSLTALSATVAYAIHALLRVDAD